MIRKINIKDCCVNIGIENGRDDSPRKLNQLTDYQEYVMDNGLDDSPTKLNQLTDYQENVMENGLDDSPTKLNQLTDYQEHVMENGLDDSPTKINQLTDYREHIMDKRADNSPAKLNHLTDDQDHTTRDVKTLIFPEKEKETTITYSEVRTLSTMNDAPTIVCAITRKKSFRNDPKFRTIMLIFQCFMAVGRYYAYDNPQALEIPLKNTLGIDNFSYNLLYSVYSIPNIIIPFIGGFIVDYYGVRTGVFIFTFVVTIGQGIIWLGGYMTNYWIILAGRVIFGLTGECIEVAHQNIAVKWFRNSLGIAIALGVSLSRIGSASNSFLTPKIYEKSDSLSAPFMTGFFVCLFSSVSGLIVIWLDRKSDEQEGILNQKDDQRFSKQLFKSDNLKSFTRLFWALVFSCGLTYGTIMGFLNISNAYIVMRFNFSSSSAGDIIAIYYLVSMVITPLAGKFTDIYGKRTYLMFASGIILLGSMLALLLVPDCNGCSTPYIIFVFLGLNISVYAAAFWPSIALVVNIKLIGIAYGFVYSILNIWLIIISMIIGKILDDWDFFAVNIYLVIQVVISFLIIFVIKYIDHHTKSRLESKQNQKQNQIQFAEI